MLSLERIPDQIGYLVVTEDGAVISSGGALENDERIANIIMSLVSLTNIVDPKVFSCAEDFEKISITYDDHSYIISLSNKKIYVIKRKSTPVSTSADYQQLIEI